MNWSKAKTILILFLLCANLFLTFELATSSYRSSHIPHEVIDSAVTLLKQRNISIDPSLIPNTVESRRLFSVENSVSDYETFAKLVFGEEVSISGDEYSCSKGSIRYSGDYFSIHFSEGVATSSELKAPAEKVRAYLKTLGINADKADVKITNNSSGIFKVLLIKQIESRPLFDCKIEAILDGTKIMSISGSWYKKSEDSMVQTAELETVPGLLVRFSAAHPEAAGTQITALKYGYVINDVEDGLYHKQSTVIPVLAVKLSNNESYYIDARAN